MIELSVHCSYTWQFDSSVLTEVGREENRHPQKHLLERTLIAALFPTVETWEPPSVHTEEKSANSSDRKGIPALKRRGEQQHSHVKDRVEQGASILEWRNILWPREALEPAKLNSKWNVGSETGLEKHTGALWCARNSVYWVIETNTVCGHADLYMHQNPLSCIFITYAFC